MAYAVRYSFAKDEWKGPFPDRAGEFCGNTHRYELEFPKRGRTFQNKRIGRPSSCQAGTSEEMAAAGYVGLYLVSDSPHGISFDETRELDTDALHEDVVSGLRPAQRPYVAPESAAIQGA